jgi:hypothetical protein
MKGKKSKSYIIAEIKIKNLPKLNKAAIQDLTCVLRKEILDLRGYCDNVPDTYIMKFEFDPKTNSVYWVTTN